MQDVSFNDLDDFLEFLPDGERRIVEVLREIILDCIPNCTEKLSYNVPYYHRHRRICFIWPASVPWGKVKMEGVQLGFCYGHLLNDDIDYLEQGTRKQVYSKTFFKVQDIDVDLVRSFIFDAVIVDEEIARGKRKGET